eukprot:3213357-Prymnesium_polylepis.1
MCRRGIPSADSCDVCICATNASRRAGCRSSRQTRPRAAPIALPPGTVTTPRGVTIPEARPPPRAVAPGVLPS